MIRKFTKMLSLTVLVMATLLSHSYANEGMWLPLYIKKLEGKMQSMGSKLTAEDIYSVNQASIKDAIVSFGGFCTGEIVSSKGLVFTNHHCGYDAIAGLSTTQNNWLKNGFWAKNNGEELAVEGLSVNIMVRMEDVTNKIKGASDKEAIMKDMIENASKEGPSYTAEVKDFFYGNEYYLVVYQQFTDIRLVGTPPENIGKFGGDTDNWMWPRHTGDFSIFRIYADANNNPADYSVNNVPYTPKKHLPISTAGVKQNDFSFIMGFPGQTQRYLTSDQITKIVDVDYPAWSSIMDVKLKSMKKFMDTDEAIKIQYASNYASYANTWKYFLGNIYSAKHSDFVNKKRKFEEELQGWILADPSRKEKWGTLIHDISELQKLDAATNKLSNYLNFGYFGPELVVYGFQFFQLGNLISDSKVQNEKAQLYIDNLKAGLDKHFKDYSPIVDKQVFIDMTTLCMQNLPKEDWPDALRDASFQKMKGANDEEKLKAYANLIYAKSFLADKSKMQKFLNKPSRKALEKDPGYQYFKSVVGLYIKVLSASQGATGKEEELMEQYMAAVMEYREKDLLYPDANFTLRLTYGEVLGYTSHDGKTMGFITPANEILDKESTTNPEFEVFPKLKTLIQNKDFGAYAEDGKLYVNFLTSHDITGGNSGSPVMNKDGALIGIAFDGNWESMVGDLSYQEKTQRTISVDIRYVLFIIDKYAGAKNIIDELTLVK